MASPGMYADELKESVSFDGDESDSSAEQTHPSESQDARNPVSSNTASLSSRGQETVQDIVTRTLAVYEVLQTIYPPNGTIMSLASSHQNKVSMQDQLKAIKLLFKRLKLIYEKCNENLEPPMDDEHVQLESLIPFKDENGNHKMCEEVELSEAYKAACEENRLLRKQVALKNKQIFEVIRLLRTIQWQINVMLSMSK